MNIKQLSPHFAIDITPRKPYAYRHTPLRYKLLKSDIPWICEQCGTTDKLEAHHIKKIKYLKTPCGSTKQNHKDNHELSNGKILCKSCHRKLHNTK